MGKLSKLRGMIKRWNSSSRMADGGGDPPSSGSFQGDDEIPSGFYPVFVGKSRRRYLLSSDILRRPIFQTLIDRSEGSAVIGCEVVLFDHLLWMLQSADSDPPSTLDELADFYAS